MFENEQDFRKLVHGLKVDDQPNPAHRERLRRQMLQAFEQAGRVGCVSRTVPLSAQGGAWYAPYRLAIAAAILIAVGIGAWSLVGRGPVTLHQVRVATQKAPWLYAVVSRYQSGEVRTERHWYNFAAQKAFAVIDDGSIVGWDYGAGSKKLSYSPRIKALMMSDLSAPGVGTDSTENLLNVFAVFAAQDKVSGSTWQYDGKTVRAFAVEKAEAGLTIDEGSPTRSAASGVVKKSVSLLKATIVADPQTRRIVAASVEYQAGAGSVLAREEWVMSYPPSGPASVYDLGIPASTPTVDTRRQRIGTPGEEPTPVAQPRGEGVSPSNRGQDARATAVPQSSFQLAPVEVQLPKPMFAGTPQDARLPNLERPRGGLRPPFLVPVGTTNVALGKPVSSSEEPVIGSLDAITDGDKEAAEGSFVELSPGPQQVTIDLQERCDIYAVLVWHYHRWPRAYLDVVVQVSDDATFKKGVKTIFNNDSDDSLGLGAGKDLSYVETYEGKLMEGKGTQGRYVRLFSNGNTRDDLNHYIEVEVYGRPLN